MIWTIAKKEFLEKILDLRVMISFVIAIVLTVVVTLVAGGDYIAKKAEYDREVARQQALKEKIRVYSQYNPVVFYPPSPLCIFSHGIDIPTPITVEILMYSVPSYSQRTAGLNPVMSMFDSLDLVSVVRVLFSLLVVLLTFDLFSGEKERGTLRQALSNPIRRGEILHGKFIGTVLVLTAVTGLTFLFAVIMLRLFAGISLSGTEYIRVGMMAFITITYLGLFAALGVLSSILLSRSSVSLAVLLFVWFFVALFQPNLNTYIVSEFDNRDWVQAYLTAKGNGDCRAENELAELQKRRGDIVDDTASHIYGEAPGRIATTGYGDFSIRVSVTDADYPILEYTMEQVRLFRGTGDCAEHDYAIYKSYCLDQFDKQLSWKRELDFLSPAALFFHSVSILSQTDVDNIDAFYEEAREYRTMHLAYLDQKGVYSTDPQMYFTRLGRDQLDPLRTAARIELYRKNPALIPWIANLAPLDLRDAPVFAVQGSLLAVDVKKTLLIMIPFFVYLMIIFLICEWSLHSYDPR